MYSLTKVHSRQVKLYLSKVHRIILAYKASKFNPGKEKFVKNQNSTSLLNGLENETNKNPLKTGIFLTNPQFFNRDTQPSINIISTILSTRYFC